MTSAALQQAPAPLAGARSGPGLSITTAGADALPDVPHRPNLLLIVADDAGVDLVGAYGEGANPPCTPSIDALAAGGLLFRNAWADPLCSPTRATLLTGRHGFRTGIGSVLTAYEPGLSRAETTLPERLTGYASTAVGKWHLAGNLGLDHPGDSGFQHYAGNPGGELHSYTSWQKVIDGRAGPTTTYATTDTTDEAIAALLTMPEPWFLYVAYNAPHTPLHVPPQDLCNPHTCARAWCTDLPPLPTTQDLGKAMMEAMDAEIGRLLVALAAKDPDAYVVFVGDNGTAEEVCEPPFLPSHAKGSMFEGGLNVPLIVRGPTVLPGECEALVSSTDLFATFAELAGVPSKAEDSVSLVPYFSDPRLALRTTVYAERFAPNGASPPIGGHARAIRGERFKLVRIDGQADVLFDLRNDPFETTKLVQGLNPLQQAAHDALAAELAALGVD